MKKMTLRSRLLLGGTCLVLVPLAVIGSFSVLRSSTALETSAAREVVLTAEDLSVLVEQLLVKELEMSKEIAARSSVIETAGRIAAEGENNPSIEADRVRVARELGVVLKEMGSAKYEGIFTTNPDGVIFAESKDVNFKGMALGDRDYIKGARSGKATIGKVVQSRQSGNPIVPIGAPILSPSGQYLGAVGIIMKIDYFVERIGKTKIGETGYAFMVDRDGTVIAYPNRDLIFKVNPGI